MATRRLVLLTLGAGASALAASNTWGQAGSTGFPNKPIRILVPYPVGTGSDAIARQVAQSLQGRLGQSVVVENKPGANGSIGSAEGARAPADGYTLTLGVHATLALNPHLYKKLQYAPGDFVGVAGLIQGTYFLVATPSFGPNNVRELIAEAKRRPGEIDYATYGVGSGSHLCGEMLNAAAGIKLHSIHYKQVPITDVAGGVLPLSFEPYVLAAPFMKDRRVKVLAITSLKRNPAFPDIPTISEVVPNFEVAPWIGLFAPKGTPRDVVDRLNREVSAVLQTEAMRSSITSTGATPLVMSAEELDKLVARDLEDARKIVEATKMSLD